MEQRAGEDIKDIRYLEPPHPKRKDFNTKEPKYLEYD
jgi:hypothetical protein